MSRNSISIYCYNFEAKECSEFTTLTDFLSYLNERDEFETYSTSKKRLTDTLGLVNIKCPHCGSEEETADEESRFDDSSGVYYECDKIYGNCKDCSKEFAWDTVTNKAIKVEESK